MLYDKKWDEIKPITKPLEPWQQHMLEAAERIRTYGWLQRCYGNAAIGYCLLGAIFANLPPEAGNAGNEAYLRFNRAIKMDATAWNDAPGRTKEQVLDMMETVALKGV